MRGRFGYCYHSVIFISLFVLQSDHIKILPLYQAYEKITEQLEWLLEQLNYSNQCLNIKFFSLYLLKLNI
jgi:hypothetical protein